MKIKFSPGRHAYLLITFFFVLIIYTGCKKSDHGDDSNGTYPFSVEFKDSYCEDFGYVILHSLDGTQVMDYQKIEGDGIADFGMLEESRVTVTMVRIDTFQSKGDLGYYIYIDSDIASPAGDWVFRGVPRKYDNTKADITVRYPEDNYESLLIYMTHSYHWEYTKNVPSGPFNETWYIYNTDPDTKVDLYASVLTQTGGYCNWLFDQNIQEFNTNYFDLELDKPVNIKPVSFSKAIDRTILSGFNKIKDENHYFRIFYHYDTSPLFTVNIKYPFDIPVSDLYLSSRGETYNSMWYYTFYFNPATGLPDQVDIPNTSVYADYNEITEEFTNIQVNGTADNIVASWIYNADKAYEFIHWRVHTENTTTTIRRPVLPKDIKIELGPNLNLMEAYQIGIFDYDETSSHADIIHRFFIEDIPAYDRYDEAFSYFYYLPTQHSSNKKPIEFDRYNAHF